MSKIVLSTLNSTYQHTAFGLRYLMSNMRELKSDTQILEFTIAQNPRDIVEKIINCNPLIVGFGVYIWNTDETLQVISLLKKVAPDIKIVLGGPEISYETESQPHFEIADHIIKGEADIVFYELCTSLLNLQSAPRVLGPKLPKIDEIVLPYSLYDTNDLTNRILYVEASRGCPYKCEYCLSSLDISVRNFPIENFLNAMESLISRGARTFKFVDRTFNLSPKISTQILNFFLSHADKNLFLHFEMVPDRLPEEIKNLITKFPPGALQFEIGVQTWNPTVAAHVSRRQDYEKIKDNLQFLKENTSVHTHVDLIVGLPGETVKSFGEGFNQLVMLQPDEIQVGILKRLKGTPIIRHDENFRMIYSHHTPFQILKNKDIDYLEMQMMNRFAKFWDLVANSGQFKTFTQFLIKRCEENSTSAFDSFLHLSKFLHNRHSQGHGIALLNLAESLWLFLKDELQISDEDAQKIIIQDYTILGKRDLPKFLKATSIDSQKTKMRSSIPERQQRHLHSF